MFSAGSFQSSGYIETKDRESISFNLTQVASFHWNGVTRLSLAAAAQAHRLVACLAIVRALAYRNVWLGNCEEPWFVAVDVVSRDLSASGVRKIDDGAYRTYHRNGAHDHWGAD